MNIMGKSTLYTTCLAACAMVLMGAALNNLVEKEPNLPSIPLDYTDQKFPEHLMFTEWGENDTTILNFIDDDIATLGRVLFYDEKLSANENLACATCHKQELSFADDTKFSMGVSRETRRNSMHLNDLGWSNKLGFFWDMSQHDLKEMISLPLKDENEIGLTDINDLVIRLESTNYYPELFSNAYGDATISEDRITEAMTHFISSMVTFNTKFDQHKKAQFNPALPEVPFTVAEERGHLIFESNCSICHPDGSLSFFGIDGSSPIGDMLFDPFMGSFFNNGLPVDENDRGMGEHMGPELDGLFKAPTLRNIEVTGPYMHDGRFSTLDEVIDHYSDQPIDEENEWTGMIIPPGGFNYTSQQKSDLKAFLMTLTDEDFLTNDKWSDPFELRGEEPQEVTGLRAYPNPAPQHVTIAFDNPQGFMVEVSILDASQRLVRKMSTHQSNVYVETSGYNSGVYTAVIRTGLSQKAIQIIVP